MSANEPEARLGHMLEMAVAAAEIASALSFEEFSESLRDQLAIVRALEVVGEAAANVDEATRESIAGVPWPQIVGFRHIVVHEYFRIDYKEVWTVATRHAPELIRRLREAGVKLRGREEE